MWLIPLINFVFFLEISLMKMLMKRATILRMLTLVVVSIRVLPRRPLLFPIELWNMLDLTTEELPRANNNIEVLHNGFRANVSFTHPMFWTFLDVLLREERIIWVRMLQNQAGHALELQRRRYADSNARILRIVKDYPNYLQHIAHNLFL